ncbi:hypothetical protein [Bradyrhizobium sp. CCBAU 51753]|uniref:hypothetical protein n=1 Tax=Bradyrhizobium sp. CCBAU 51753 TaxID=1325100 RepID=UPI00188B8169|nr:hypothetical protein [Bradyrhizobium sp. CCBAU 51753]QOZ24248.1 hypothetical protein XH93_12225 [Bradyrhizobium sp. CCBAU 51753]
MMPYRGTAPAVPHAFHRTFRARLHAGLSAFSGRFLLCLFADACRRFGGAVVVISADQILGKSTNDLLEAFIAQLTR